MAHNGEHRSPKDRLPLIVGKEFAGHADLHAVPFRALDPFDDKIKINGAHDAIAELFMDQLFDRIAINVDDLEKAIDERSLNDAPM